MGAEAFPEHHHGLFFEEFGILAPGAAQAAPLEEDGRAEACAVMDVEVLDVRDVGGEHARRVPLP